MPPTRRGLALCAALAAVAFAAGCGVRSTTSPIIKPNTSSRSWQDLHLTTSFAQANALADFHGELYAGGAFFDAAGWPRSSLLAWNGSIWRLVGSQPNGDVMALAVHGDRLYAGGTFTHAGYDTLNYLGAWDGVSWHSVGRGMDWNVDAISSFAGNLVAAGVFLHAGGVPAFHIASWNGTQWQALGPGLDDAVTALTEYHGELIAGGFFTNAGATPAHFIAAWNGTSWRPLGGASDLNGVVRALYVHHDTLYVGGHFTTAGGVPATHVACWTGMSWDSVGAGLGTYVDEPVLSFSSFGDHLIAGGAFFGGTAEWKAGLWYPMGILTGETDALAVSRSRLYAGGYFMRGPGQTQNGVALWVE